MVCIGAIKSVAITGKRENNIEMKEKMMEEFTFFWRGPFAQWWLSPFTDKNGVEYRWAETYMMYQKALLFNDTVITNIILTCNHPRDCQKFGREVHYFDQGIWDRAARDIVYDGNILKFTQNPELRSKLFSTAGTTLVEASPYDDIWGIKLSETDPRAQNRATWLGTNWLGETLTRVRDDLLNQVKIR